MLNGEKICQYFECDNLLQKIKTEHFSFFRTMASLLRQQLLAQDFVQTCVYFGQLHHLDYNCTSFPFLGGKSYALDLLYNGLKQPLQPMTQLQDRLYIFLLQVRKSFEVSIRVFVNRALPPIDFPSESFLPRIGQEYINPCYLSPFYKPILRLFGEAEKY